MVRLPANVTTLRVRDALAAMLQLPDDCNSLFALWVKAGPVQIRVRCSTIATECSPNNRLLDFQFQLTDDSHPVDDLNRIVQQLHDDPTFPRTDADATPKLVFKRDVFLSLVRLRASELSAIFHHQRFFSRSAAQRAPRAVARGAEASL